MTGPGAAGVCLGIWGPPEGRSDAGGVLAEYEAAIAAACRQRGGAFVPLAAVHADPAARGPAGRRTPFGLSDAAHPNDLGHRRIALLVLAAARLS